jgi:SAM-dependent methyltransferase
MADMTPAPGEYRIYADLAAWWPLISPPQQYAAEAAYLGAVLGSAQVPVREVLDLGSGGGHVAMHLAERLAVTLVDISPEMLAVSRRLNPQCAHHQGDMRTIRLGRTFDAVLVHDAVDYMTSESDLALVIETAFAHCRPGGVALFVPDHIHDEFRAASGGGGGGDLAGRQASFREWTWDPDPSDTWVQAEYEFLLRAADGTVQVVHEKHRLGAFSRAAWRRLLAAAGFHPQSGIEPPARVELAGGRRPANLFVGRRPARRQAGSGREQPVDPEQHLPETGFGGGLERFWP